MSRTRNASVFMLVYSMISLMAVMRMRVCLMWTHVCSYNVKYLVLVVCMPLILVVVFMSFGSRTGLSNQNKLCIRVCKLSIYIVTVLPSSW